MNRVLRLLISKRILLAVAALIVFQSSAPHLMAIPAFARKYKTACATCHNNWPELNDFGRAFKINGFKFPKDDEQMVKDPPLLLGAQAQKEAFPNSIFPGELPILPIAFRYSGYFSYNSPQPAAVNAASGYVPSTTLFSPNTVTLLAAGSFGPSIAFWFDDDLSAAGSGAAGGLGDGWIKANNFLGHAFHIPQNQLNVRYGQFELDLPFTQARTINLSTYAIYDQASVAASGGTTNNPFVFSAPQTGIEFGGYPNRGYSWWTVAVVDGVNGNSTYGTSAPLVGRNNKDVYVHLSQRFDLERSRDVRKEIQASDQTGVHDHTSIRFDGFAYYGINKQNQDGNLYPGLPTLSEPFYRAGGAFDYKYRSKFELWGLYDYGHDENHMVNDSGTGYVSIKPVTFTGGFLEAEYWIYPWMTAMMRYDGVNSPTDHINGVSRYDTRSTYSPAIYFLVRPNIKLETQYSFNYEQPIPGSTNFYRANQLLTGVDFLF